MSVPKLKKHDNGYFYVHWTRGRRSSRESTRAKELPAAKAYFSEWLKLQSEAPAAVEAVLKVSDLWAAYHDKHVRPNVASVQTADWSWKNLAAGFGGLTVEEVTQAAVERYAKARVAGRIGRPSSAPTIRRELVALRACLNWCAGPKRKLIRPDAVQPFDLPPSGAPRERWLRVEEIERLLAAAHEEGRLSRCERFLWLALETAARKGAICQLTWDRVDLETGVINYVDTTIRQTKKRRAVVPISAKLRPVLERAYAERVNDFVLDHAGEIEKSVYRAADRAGLDDVSPHVLRHTAATHMARNGVSLWKIAKVLGNTFGVVERVYAKHCPDDLREAVDLISNGR
jgi:integrase